MNIEVECTVETRPRLASAVKKFTDPDAYQCYVGAGWANLKSIVTGPGAYRAELTRVDLHQLGVGWGRISLPRVIYAGYGDTQSSVLFQVPDTGASSIVNGAELQADRILFAPAGTEAYHRISAGMIWGGLCLAPAKLAAAVQALAEYELIAPASPRMIRPPPHLLQRLRRLHEAACQLAATVPDILAHPEVARAMEQELIGVMVGCLTEGQTPEAKQVPHARLPVMRRFEEVLEARKDSPLYVPDICASIGVSDRTLRMHCMAQLGISPHRYLWLRRMNLARRVLSRTDPQTKSVTEIAMDHGFAELGRFSVAYRKLFGESPSATLRGGVE